MSAQDPASPNLNKTCGQCLNFDGYCHDSRSDHYGHNLATYHPACNQFEPEEEELKMCKECGVEYVLEEGQKLCATCRKKKGEEWIESLPS